MLGKKVSPYAFGPAPIRRIVFKQIDKMDSEIGFEMSLIVVESIRGRCASFTILTATVSEIFGGQTNSYILVVCIYIYGMDWCGSTLRMHTVHC